MVEPQPSEPPARVASPSKPGDVSPEALGAAMGVAGIGGAFVVQNGERLAGAVRGVRPLTARGTLRVAAWIGGFVALGLLIRWLLPLPTWAAVLIALVTMCLVSLRWERRRKRP